MSQLALPLKLQDHAVFDSFLPIGNEPLIAFLTDTVTSGEGPGNWIWGGPSTGKTHLLQAVCERASDRAQYVPLREFSGAGPAILDGLANRQFICLDDLDAVAGDRDWERGLFALYHELVEENRVLICSAIASPRECRFELADLTSRFSRLPAFHVHPLDHASRISALQLRARHRGLELPDDTAGFLLARSKRDMSSLYALLDKLDTEALKAKRRLTIPFVKKVIEPSQAI